MTNTGHIFCTIGKMHVIFLAEKQSGTFTIIAIFFQNSGKMNLSPHCQIHVAISAKL